MARRGEHYRAIFLLCEFSERKRGSPRDPFSVEKGATRLFVITAKSESCPYAVAGIANMSGESRHLILRCVGDVIRMEKKFYDDCGERVFS